jgi:small subunit ribosomal protein S20
MPHIPNHPSAEKRHRQNLKRRIRNRQIKSHVHSAMKGALEAIASGDSAKCDEAFRAAAKELSKAATKGAIHKNTAARKTARLAARLHRAAQARVRA